MIRSAAAVQVLSLSVLALTGCDQVGTSDVEELSGPILSAEPLFRLGSIDDPTQNFTRVESVVIGPAGEIIVADPQANVVRIFGEDGEPLRTVGAPGTGPGHFSSLWRVDVRGDTLLAFDNSMVVSAFTLDGIFRRIVWGPGEQWMFFRESPSGMRFGYVPMAPQALIGDTSAIISPNIAYAPGPLDCTPGSRGFVMPVPYLLTRSDGSIADTIIWSERVNSSLLLVSGSDTHVWYMPFRQTVFFGALPEGRGILIADERPSAAGEGSAVRLTALSPQRDTLWQRELPISSIPITAENLAEAAVRVPPRLMPGCSSGDAASATAPSPEQVATAYRSSKDALTHLPALTGLTVGQDGSIWLRREELAPDSTTWQLLDPEGEPVGVVQLPIGQRVVAARGSAFVTTEVDELEVPYLVRYRLEDR